jgi:tetratricopeptide (TPR) repeat protein
MSASDADPWALVEAGEYFEAVPLLRRDAEGAARECGPHSVEAAEAYNRLGVACKFAGLFDDAEAAYALALPVAEQIADEDSELLAALLHNLGGLAHSRGLPNEAEPLARRGLAIRETSCPDPRGIAADEAALAAILEALERWDEAERSYRRALSIWSELGDDYEIAMTLNGLAATVRFGGRPEEAEPMFREALAIIEADRGATHPDTATIRNNLAMLLNATGRAVDALPLLEQAAADLEALLGPDHPATVDIRGNRDRIAAQLQA